ncbi:hypothetical protein ABT063_15700 [Streptomyces sp. NPDC002838]|uniref:DUF6907 domain-containing protein n=1 Tax=Streptomyces sp. NPDC002838 TaxID=3154436 RepID=UPI003327D724
MSTATNPFGLMATPALDLAPTGHLPYVVDQARPHPDTKTVTVLIGRAELDDGKGLCAIWWPVTGVEYDVEAAYDPARISLADAETRLRAQLAERGMQVTEFRNEDAPLTAAQRGPAWIAQYGCNPQCQLDHAGPDGEPGWHSTAPIETQMRDIDSDPDPDGPELPFLGAQVYVSGYRPQAYGRTTKVWVHNGPRTGELTPAKARQVAREMREFAARLDVLCDQAEEIAVGDFEGDPEVYRLDREHEDARIRAITKGRA